MVVRNCSQVTLANSILIDSFGWSIYVSGFNGVRMFHVRILGWRANCDGTDIEYCRDVAIDGCFWRTSDDCIAVKALFPPGEKGNPFDSMINPEVLNGTKAERIVGDEIGGIIVTRSVIWNDDPGNAFEMGFELRADIIAGITFSDCDIIHAPQGSAISIRNSDRAVIRDILSDGVRVEDTDELLDFYVGLSVYSNDAPFSHRRNNPDRIPRPEENRVQTPTTTADNGLCHRPKISPNTPPTAER